MNERVEGIAGCAERVAGGAEEGSRREPRSERAPIEDLPVHGFPGRRSASDSCEKPHFSQSRGEVGHPSGKVENDSQNKYPERLGREPEQERERRIYRGRTVAMLRRYMRYSIETGRLPSLLGREFFRSKVTSYIVVTFEDRVIFVHDMETCLEKLDEFSRQLIARHILQEHDRWATARLLNCNEKTIRRLAPLVLDQLSEILLDVGLMERLK